VKHDCMDVGGRATHGAVAEDARTEFSVNAGIYSLLRHSGLTARDGGNAGNAWSNFQ